jgi:hypothetical protein
LLVTEQTVLRVDAMSNAMFTRGSTSCRSCLEQPKSAGTLECVQSRSSSTVPCRSRQMYRKMRRRITAGISMSRHGRLATCKAAEKVYVDSKVMEGIRFSNARLMALCTSTMNPLPLRTSHARCLKGYGRSL